MGQDKRFKIFEQQKDVGLSMKWLTGNWRDVQ